MCYTYDNLSRVTARTVKKLSDNSVISTETYNYDAAGNVTPAPDSSFQYDTNNRLISFNGNTVSYDLDGNMLSNGSLTCTYDYANRLISAGGHTYTYNAENVRIRNLCTDADTTYTYNTNCKLSRLLTKTTNGITTKYVYGRGLIGEEKQDCGFKTYHFDCRGSTIAITGASGNITDTFAYDSYGKLISRTGTSFVIFCYNGKDGVVTDKNGLIHMRARYYSPEMRRFINADIVSGQISNAVTLNRFAYANGNPVSLVDPFGLCAREAEYPIAIYVVDTVWGQGGLPVLGHTRLYFYSDNEGCCYTEFTGDLSEGKSSAEILFRKNVILNEISYDFETNTVTSSKGVHAVVLNGNFDKSVSLAEHYYDPINRDYGGYNLFFNNCSDYTDELLSVADIDGLYLPSTAINAPLISIPNIRIDQMDSSSHIDTTIKDIGNTYVEFGEDISGNHPILGKIYNNIGNLIIDSSDLIGDAISSVAQLPQSIIDDAKTFCQALSDPIYTGVTYVWNLLLNKE